MHHRTLPPAVFALTLALGCSQGRSASSAAALDQPLRWTATLRPTRTRSEAAMVPSELTRAFGTVALTASESDPTRTHARLTVSLQVQSQQLRWAILPGPCGANTLPLVGFEAYPLIDIGASGRGEVEAELPLVLATPGEYHVNIYDQGQQISDVLTCGTLKREGEAN